MTIDERPGFAQTGLVALVVGAVGLAVCAFAGVTMPDRVMPGYLVGFTFWVSVSLGCLAVVLVHQLVGGQWGVPTRRIGEAGAATIPLMAALFVPIALGLRHLYRWAEPGFFAHEHHMAHKAAYLNPTWFTARGVAYFAFWTVTAWVMLTLSRRRDRVEGRGPSWWMSRLAGPGIVIYFGSMSLAAVDWMMSREPDWASTIYGAMVIVGQVLSGLAMMIVLSDRLSRKDETLDHALTPGRLGDLGNLLLAFTMLWAYMAFSQFLIIWSGNLKEEIPWYVRRTHAGYGLVALVLILFHFAVPFLVLMFRDSKRSRSRLVAVALAVAVIHVIDLAWLILPASADPRIPRVSGWDIPMVIASTVGIGGLWMVLFLRIVSGAPLVMPRDPITGEAPEEEGGHHG